MVGEGDEQLGGGDGADAGLGEQLGREFADERNEFVFEVVGFGLEGQGATGGGAQGQQGGVVLGVVAGTDA